MKALKTKKAKEERLSWFESWLGSINERINNWIDSLSDELSQMLDGSPESLPFIEEYLLSKFNNPRLIEQVENAEEMDAITTYIGEVLVNNLPDHPKWEVSMEDISSFETFFLPFIKRPKPLISFKIFDEIPYLVNMREGNILSKMYENEIRQYEKYKDKVIPFEKNIIQEDKEYSHQRFVWLREFISIKELEQKIKEFLVNYKFGVNYRYSKENQLDVELVKFKYSFHFQLDDSIIVSEEAKEFSEEYTGRLDKKEVANCTQRIEFWGDKDEENRFLDFAEDFIYRIYDNYKVIIHDFKNGVFYGEQN